MRDLEVLGLLQATQINPVAPCFSKEFEVFPFACTCPVFGTFETDFIDFPFLVEATDLLFNYGLEKPIVRPFKEKKKKTGSLLPCQLHTEAGS